MTDPKDGFNKLEEKIARAVEAFRRIQTEKRAFEQEVEKLRGGAKERLKQWEAQERELQALRREREEVRARLERMLEQVEALTRGESGG